MFGDYLFSSRYPSDHTMQRSRERHAPTDLIKTTQGKDCNFRNSKRYEDLAFTRRHQGSVCTSILVSLWLQFHRNEKRYFCNITLTEMLNTSPQWPLNIHLQRLAGWVNYFQEHQRTRRAVPVFYTCRVQVAASFLLRLCYGYYMAVAVRSSPITADRLVSSLTMSDSLTLESNCSW